MVNWDQMLAFQTPRMIRIEDWRLGSLNYVLQLIFVIFIIIIPVINNPAEFFIHHTPTTALSWYAESGNMYKQQDKDQGRGGATSKADYCDDSKRSLLTAGTRARAEETGRGNNKFDTDTSCTTSLDEPPTESEKYWFEYDHKCVDLSYDEVISPGESQ